MSRYLLSTAARRLSRDQQTELAREYIAGGRTDRRIRDRLVLANILLAIKLAHRVAPAGYDHERVQDLIQAGTEGLIHSLQKYDPDKGVALTTYAGFWARAYMARHLIRNWRLVRWGKTNAQVRIWHRLWREEARLLSATGEASPAALAECMGVTEQEVMEALTGEVSFLSARRWDSGPGTSIEEQLPDPQAVNPEAAAIETLDSEWAWNRIAEMRFKPREREILLRRLDGESTTAIGADLGVHRARVQQIEAAVLRLILKRLRRAAREETL